MAWGGDGPRARTRCGRARKKGLHWLAGVCLAAIALRGCSRRLTPKLDFTVLWTIPSVRTTTHLAPYFGLHRGTGVGGFSPGGTHTLIGPCQPSGSMAAPFRQRWVAAAPPTSLSVFPLALSLCPLTRRPAHTTHDDEDDALPVQASGDEGREGSSSCCPSIMQRIAGWVFQGSGTRLALRFDPGGEADFA